MVKEKEALRMYRFAVIFLVAGLLTMTTGEARGQAPRAPSYLILRAPAQKPQGRPYYPGRGYEVKPQAYAYGWFGAGSRSRWRRQTGYHGSYIRWTKD
jgi:hypothetical protein